MVDKKISELNELTIPVSVDLVAIVDDPAGTAETKKITYANIESNLSVTASQVSDFDTEVSNNTSVSANTTHSSSDGTDHSNVVTNDAKVTNATHTGDVTGDTGLTIGVDKVNDTHIDFGTGANQVSTADLPEETNLYYTEGRVTANTNVSSNTTHRSSNGTDHANVVTNDAKVSNATHTGDVTGDVGLTIANDAVDIVMLSATGTPGGTTFLRGDNTWSVPAGGGNVSKVGTPVDNQVGVWTGDGTIEGTTGLTYNGTNLQLTGDIGATGTRITKGWFTDLQVTNNISGSITGNSATATALESARTIGGVSFNGTANITVASATGGFAVSSGNLTLTTNDVVLTGAIGRDTDNEINWGTDDSLALVIGGTTSNIVSISTGAGDNDKLVTQGYVDDNAGGGLSWNEVTGTSQGASVNNGYITNNAGLVTVTLPDTAALGSVIRIAGLGAGGWKVAQNASELIYFGNSTTTTGTGGSLASTHSKDAIELVCVVANTSWAVISSVGNITVV